MLPDDPRHGSPAGRKKHTKDGEEPCDRCKRAAARYQNERELDAMRGQPRTVSTVGVQRRIRALVALGYTYPVLAERLGVSGAQVFKWAKGGAYIRDTSRVPIVDMYEDLCMTHPAADTMLERRNAKYARTIATKRGWLPPLAWDNIDDEHEQPSLGAHDTGSDPMVVERILAGDWRLKATPEERHEVIRRWDRSDNELERRTGWNLARDRRAMAAAELEEAS